MQRTAGRRKNEESDDDDDGSAESYNKRTKNGKYYTHFNIKK